MKYLPLNLSTILIFIILIFPISFGASAISQCQTISVPGEYYLSGLLTSEGTDCIVIQAGNVTLDCKWNTIVQSLSGANGIFIDSVNGVTNNITIKNCIIKNFDYGIQKTVISRENFTFENIKLIGNRRGVYFFQAKNINITNVTITNAYFSGGENVYGIYISDSQNITIDHVNISYLSYPNGVAYGIYVQKSSFPARYINIENSRIHDISHYGIYISGASDIKLNNVLIKNSSFGLFFQNSNNNLILNSKIIENTNTGLTFISSNSSTIYNNLFNNSLNVNISSSFNNSFNTTVSSGKRIFSTGLKIAGNFWAKLDGNGYSEICEDKNRDGFCDYIYDVTNTTTCAFGVNCSTNIDFYPYSLKYALPEFSNISVKYPKNYSLQEIVFNVTITHFKSNINISYVLLESNISGVFENYSMNLRIPFNITKKEGVYSFNTSSLPSGYFVYRFCANASDGFWNCTKFFNFTIHKALPNITLLINNTPNNFTIKWYDVVEILVNESNWIDRNSNYSLWLNSSILLSFLSSNITNQHVIYLSGLSSGVYKLVFNVSEGRNFTSNSAVLFINVTKGWEKNNYIMVGKQYKYDANSSGYPVTYRIVNNYTLNSTVIVGEPLFLKVIFEINNTNNNTELKENFTDILFRLYDFISDFWINYTEANVTIPELNFSQAVNISFTLYNVTANETSYLCNETLMNGYKNYTCHFNVTVYENEYTPSLEIKYTISQSKLPSWSNRQNIEWNVDGNKRNVSAYFTSQGAEFIIGTNHSNSSLDSGIHTFFITYIISLQSETKSNTNQGSSSGGGDGEGGSIGGFMLPINENETKEVNNASIRNLSETIHETIEIIINLTPNSSKVEISNPKIPVYKIILKSKKNVTATLIVREVRNETLPEIENVYKYFEISIKNTSRDIENGEIYFEVNKSWLKKINANASEITLLKLFNTTWKPLLTFFIGETNSSYRYKAKINSFSYFAIAYIPKNINSQEKSYISEEKIENKPKEENAGSATFLSSIFYLITFSIVAMILIIPTKLRKKRKTKVRKKKRK